MAENPLPTELTQTSVTPYILGVGGLLALAAIFVLGILYLRPEVDPLALMGQVGVLLGAAIPGILAFIKSGESKAISVAAYHINNHAIEEFKSTLVEKARMEGEKAGATDEKARADAANVVTVKQDLARAEGVAEGKAGAAPSAVAVNGAVTTAEPVPVKVVAAVPVPVKETAEKPR